MDETGRDTHTSYHLRRGGAISLMTILVLSGLLMEFTLVGLTTSFLSGDQGLGLRASHEALYAARSGANDVLLRIARDKTFVPDPNPYTIEMDGSSASIQVTRTLPDATHIQYSIVSTGIADLKRVNVVTTVIIDDTTGAISNVGMVESGI